MVHCKNMHLVSQLPVHDAVGSMDYLSQVRLFELRDHAAGLRKPGETLHGCYDSLADKTSVMR